MPQKKNPDPLELIRGKSGRAIGHLAGWLATMKGLPAGYNKDLQEDKEAVFEAEDTLDACLRAATTVVETLAMRLDRTTRAAGGFMLATDVADFLVARGLPFRAAHELVGRIVRDALASGRALETMTLDEWRSYSPLFDERVHEAVTPGASVRARRTPQSTGPAHVAAAVADLRGWVAVHACA
jgi:argininosuccinate lyase